MIHYFCLNQHSYTISHWLAEFDRGQRGDIQVLGYRRLLDVPDMHTVIFTDFDRLKENERALVGKICDALREDGCRVLNHPGKSLLRYDLQQVLNNDFSVYRKEEVARCRFPVFVRREDEHRGSATDLIHDSDGLSQALSEGKGDLTVEYLDSSDAHGVFRKYSAFCINDEIVPRHILFSKHWEVKSPDLVNQSNVDEEMAYVESNPHREKIARVFHLANIQYGRIDYSFYQGRMQVWEINTNPMLRIPDRSKHESRRQIHEMSAERINQAFLALHQSCAEH